jgi:alpha-N-arabinofuranosidase
VKRCASTVTLAVLTIVATSATVAKGAEQEVPNGERPASLEAVVTIDADAPSVPYSRMLFGGFLEHFHHQIYGGIFEPGSPLSDERGFRTDVIAAMKELKLSIVRWPGGCFVSGYHWKDGVGNERKSVFDVVWGVEDPNTFGTDEFVEWCWLVGCEPYICTNAGNGTPEEMRQWVEYCNSTTGPYAELRKTGRHPEPLNVRYWSIGNENWGPHEIGHKTPEQWGPLVNRSAEMMSSVSGNLTLLAAATPNRDWTLPLLSTAGKHLDSVAIHEYWLRSHDTNLTPDYLGSVILSEGPEKTISSVIDIIDEAGYRGRIKIAFDEWNLRGWHHPGFPRKQVSNTDNVGELIKRRDINADAAQYTMADALFSASFLNACLRHAEDVDMANIAPIVNTRGPLYVHPDGIVRRTTFHTLAMYANELESRVGRIDIESGTLERNERVIDHIVRQLTERRDYFSAEKFKRDTLQPIPMIDGIATVDESGRQWSIAIVNRRPSKQVACKVKMNDALLTGTYEAKILSGDSPDAFNSVEHPDRVVPEKTDLEFVDGVVLLPPHSLTIFKLARRD